jgi:hypothetical protein
MAVAFVVISAVPDEKRPRKPTPAKSKGKMKTRAPRRR